MTGEWYNDCILIVHDSHLTVCILLYTVNNFSIYSLQTMSTKKKTSYSKHWESVYSWIDSVSGNKYLAFLQAL